MVNTLLTVIFDIVLIGTALVILCGMVAEYRASKQPSVGGQRLMRFTPQRARRRRKYAGSVGASAIRRRVAA